MPQCVYSSPASLKAQRMRCTFLANDRRCSIPHCAALIQKRMAMMTIGMRIRNAISSDIGFHFCAGACMDSSEGRPCPPVGYLRSRLATDMAVFKAAPEELGFCFLIGVKARPRSSRYRSDFTRN
jgi:hypothetical protein